MNKSINLVIVGTGGQGALTLMEMLALAAELAEREIRVLSRVSLARLGGTGICHVRLGPARSASIPVGEADLLLALELSEILRILPLARRGARAFVNTYQRLPIAAGVAGIKYPAQTEIAQQMVECGVSPLFVPAQLPPELFAGAQIRRINMLMLGVLCGATALLPRPNLEAAIELRSPQFARQSQADFALGWQFAETFRQGVDIVAPIR